MCENKRHETARGLTFRSKDKLDQKYLPVRRSGRPRADWLDVTLQQSWRKHKLANPDTLTSAEFNSSNDEHHRLLRKYMMASAAARRQDKGDFSSQSEGSDYSENHEWYEDIPNKIIGYRLKSHEITNKLDININTIDIFTDGSYTPENTQEAENILLQKELAGDTRCTNTIEK